MPHSICATCHADGHAGGDGDALAGFAEALAARGDPVEDDFDPEEINLLYVAITPAIRAVVRGMDVGQSIH